MASGSLPTIFCASCGIAEPPWASMPTASIAESVPRPSVRSRIAVVTSSTALESTTSMPCRRAIALRSGTLSTAMTRAPR